MLTRLNKAQEYIISIETKHTHFGVLLQLFSKAFSTNSYDLYFLADGKKCIIDDAHMIQFSRAFCTSAFLQIMLSPRQDICQYLDSLRLVEQTTEKESIDDIDRNIEKLSRLGYDVKMCEYWLIRYNNDFSKTLTELQKLYK